jgi:DnaD/phage-associated family protein
MKKFSGFPSGRLAFTQLPDLFFSELLPLIDSVAELKVTLHVFWRLHRRTASQQYVTLQELLEDRTLLRGLRGLSSPPDKELRTGLEQAVARGTLLHLKGAGGEEHFYFANSARGRRAVERALLDELELVEGAALTEAMDPIERPNIFVLYEQNIGLLQPMIAEELKDAERVYPPKWIEEAFRIAVENNVRNWKYVNRILERWAAEGKDEGRSRSRERSWYEEYEKFIKR